MSKIITVKVDTNDGDYETVSNEIADEELEAIRPVVEAIKSFKPYQADIGYTTVTHRHNFPFAECWRENMGEKSVEEYYVESGLVTEEQLDTFIGFIPFVEYGFHTVESVTVREQVPEEVLL